MPSSLIAQKRKNFIIYLLSIFLLHLPLFITPVMAHEVLREQWVTTYDSPLGGSDTVTAMTIDNSGNIYVTGTSDGNYATVKYDSQGNQLWAAQYDSGGVDSATDLAVDIKGNLYVTGSSSHGYDIIKYDPDGNQRWVARYAEVVPRERNFLTADSKGNIYMAVTGATGSSTEIITIKYNSQGNQQWISRYGKQRVGGYLMGSASNIAVDSNDNIYVSGWVPDSNGYYEDYCTIKYDSDGSQLWVATYDGGIGDYPSSLIIDTHNNIYITGYSMYGSIPAGYGTIKYDSEGKQLWVARYKPAYSDCGHVCMATALAVDAGGNVYVTGGARYDPGNHINIIKYDPYGNELWVNRYEGKAQPTALAVDSSGNLYVSGYIANSSDSGYSIITIKYSPEGKILWEDHIPNANKSSTKLAVDRSGNAYMVGTANNDYATIKYNTNGNKIWQATYDDPAGGNDSPTDLALDSRGNIYVTGYSSSNSSASDSATIKYNPQGQRVWIAKYDKSGVGKDQAQALAIDNHDNIYVTGSSYNPDTSSTDFTTIKYDSDGNELWVARDDGGFEYFSRTYNGLADQVYAFAIDNGGNVYVTGISTGPCSGCPYCDQCVHLLTSKHDSNGNRLWIKLSQLGTLMPPASDVGSVALAADRMGNVYIGVLWRVGSPTIIKYDTDGNQLWKINIGYAGYGGDIALDNSEYLIVTGSNGTAKYDKDGKQVWSVEFGGRSLKLDSTNNVYVLETSCGHVIKYDKDGNKIWQRPGTGDFTDYSGRNCSMTLGRNDNVYVSTNYGSDYSTIKFDTEGNRLWVVRYDGGGSDSPTALVVDPYGNIYVAGSSDLAGRGSDIIIIKYFQISDNHPPYIPAIPDPAHGATGIAINTILSWAGGDPDAGDTVTYNIYFGKIISQPEVFIPGHGTTSYDPGTLNYSTTYYWQMVAFDNHGAFIVGPAWSFSTEQAPPSNNSPNTPSNPSPADGATGQAINTTLSWSGGDPDQGDTVTYYIYFATSSSPPLVKSGHDANSYNPGALNYSTTYYWRVVAKDNHGAETGGSVWSFTTLSTPNQSPIAQAGPDQVLATGSKVTLDGSGSTDPDGDSLSYSWTLVSKPTGSNVDLSDKSSQNISFTPDKDGLYKFQLIVSDGQAQSSPDYVTVQVLGQENKVVIATNKTQYQPGDTLELYIWIGNAATASELSADVFLGFGLPAGSLYFFDPDLNLKPANPTDPRSFIPIGRGVTVPPSFVFPSSTEMNADSDGNGKLDTYRLFSVTLPAGLPPGPYFAFAALAEPGSAQTGSPRLLSPISLAHFSFTP